MNLIVYGSLIDTRELTKVFEKREKSTFYPVKIWSFKRIFNKVANWRSGEGRKVAVLNVVKTCNPNDFFNGILISNLKQSDLRRFEEREQGYKLIEIRSRQIRPYCRSPSLCEPIYTFTALGTRISQDIDPIPKYAELVLNGARSWGKQFFEDFKKTTFNANGTYTYLCH